VIDLEAQLRRLVAALCAPQAAGRAPGTAEGRAARAAIIAALGEAGVEPAGTHGWEQPLSIGANVLGRVVGASRRTVLVAAHYDHLGRAGGEVYWGADDNAAAVAILVELGRALAVRPAPSDVLLCAFDSEEPPHFLTDQMGSEAFARQPTVPLQSIDLMVCLDLVGHAVGEPGLPRAVRDSMFVFGAEMSEGTAALVDRIGRSVEGVVARRAGINLLPPLSDYHPFHQRGVPFLFLTNGRWRHYHTPDDTPDRLDYAKMAATARWLEVLVRAAGGPRRFLPDGRDDPGSLATLAEVAHALVDHWPEARRILARTEALASATGRLTPSGFTELRMLHALVEARLA
jgi:Zn-dependent M28 family amino/carboxypeptidase